MGSGVVSLYGGPTRRLRVYQCHQSVEHADCFLGTQKYACCLSFRGGIKNTMYHFDYYMNMTIGLDGRRLGSRDVSEHVECGASTSGIR